MTNCANVILWVQSKTKLLVRKTLPRGSGKRSDLKETETLIQEWMVRAFSTYPNSTWLIWGLSSFHFCFLNKHPDQSNLRRGLILVYNSSRQQGVTVVRAQAAAHITSAVRSNESICAFLACFQIAFFTLTRFRPQPWKSAAQGGPARLALKTSPWAYTNTSKKSQVIPLTRFSFWKTLHCGKLAFKMDYHS